MEAIQAESLCGCFFMSDSELFRDLEVSYINLSVVISQSHVCRTFRDIKLLLLFCKPAQIFCLEQTVIQLEPEDSSFSTPRPIILDHLGPETLPYSLCTVTGWYILPQPPLFLRSQYEADLRGVQHVWPFKPNQLFVGSGFVFDALLGTFLWFVICFSSLNIFLPHVEVVFLPGFEI